MRYAAYFAPAHDSPLDRLGSSFLGRDAYGNSPLTMPAIDGISPERQAEITADARRYGFHATLKAPIALVDGASRDVIHRVMTDIAERHQAFDLPLHVAAIEGFTALIPQGPNTALDALAADCVRSLDPLRLPESPEAQAKRRRAGLDAVEAGYLETWGYPYVFDRFRFHMTLSCRLAGVEAEQIRAAAHRHFDALLSEPVAVDHIALFIEPEPGAPFAADRLFPLRPA